MMEHDSTLRRGSGYWMQLVICRFITLGFGDIKPTYRGYNPGYYPLTKYPEPLSMLLGEAMMVARDFHVFSDPKSGAIWNPKIFKTTG